MIYGMKPKTLAYPSMDYLAHHGIAGQKWGKRRYQNPDGSLTPEGREHYGVGKEIKQLPLSQRQENAIKAFNERSKKDPTQMSDEELFADITRMELENRYTKALNESEGKKQANAIANYENKIKERRAQVINNVVSAGTATIGAAVTAGIAAQFKNSTGSLSSKLAAAGISALTTGIPAAISASLKSYAAVTENQVGKSVAKGASSFVNSTGKSVRENITGGKEKK